MAQMLPQVANAVRGLPGPRRAVFAGIGAIAIAALFLVGTWASKPAMVTLYYDLPLAEAGKMREALTAAGIVSELGGNGSEVRVAQNRVAEARVLLAGQGMPLTGRQGFELFDVKQSWGMTEFDQRVTYQRALEGELARTVGTIAGVQQAKVHLVLPTPSAIRRNEKSAEASVVLTMKPGVMLSPGSVQGIVYIVSNSVEGLTPQSVAVMDDGGRILSAPDGQTGFAGLTSRQMEIQQQVEEHLARKAERLLATIGGIGSPRVTVSADLNFEQVDRTVETFDPEGQVLTSEQRSETEAGSTSAGAQTIISNSYQNSRVLERIARNGGGISRLTVAVLVDQRAMAADTLNPAPTAARIADLDGLMRNALGVDSARGDRLSITAIPMAVMVPESMDLPPPPAPGILQLVERFLRPAIGLTAVLAILVLAFRMARPSGVLARDSAAASSESAAHPLASVKEPPPLSPPSETVLLKNRVQEEAAARPELAAQAVRAWMAES